MRTLIFATMVLSDLLAGRPITTAGPGMSAGDTVPGDVGTIGDGRPEPGRRSPRPTARRRRKVVHPYRTPALKP